MVKGAPDHFKGVALYAWDGSELVLIKVDSDGQLYALLMGDYDGTPTAIKVAQTGELYALLKAVYNDTKIDVLADVDGNLTLNLAAQDLGELINRPKYGGADGFAGLDVNCPAGQTTSLGYTSAKGMTYGGYVYINEAWNAGDVLIMACDTRTTDSMTIGQAWADDLTVPRPGQLYITNYDLVTPRLNIGIGGGLTFETKYELLFYAVGTDRTVSAEPTFALV